MAVIYKRNAVQSCNLHYCLHHELQVHLLGKFCLLSPFFSTHQDKISEENLIA